MKNLQFWESGRRRGRRDGSRKETLTTNVKEDVSIESIGLFPLEPLGVDLGAAPPLLDIIAVHGLGGHWQKTWTAENGKLWLRDFMPAQLSRLDIKAAFWSYGWNAGIALSTAVTGLVDEAEMLLDRIQGERITAAEKARPIVFVAHSLGGILVKKAMIRAQERSNLYGELLSKIHGIVFLGTPHRGSDVAYWASFPAKLLKALQLGTGTNTGYLKALTRNSEEFSCISQQWVERSRGLVIRTFFETDMLHGVLVVDKDSAMLQLANETAVGLAGCNHRTMCRFDDANSQRYRPLLNAIRQIARELRERTMASAAAVVSMPGTKDANGQHAFFMETIGSFDYTAYRRRNPEREPGTCQWITRHHQFQSWINTAEFNILWISGDPGCGKSVAASYLVSYLEETQPSTLTAHFFFKDDSDKQSKATSALCAVLHQILLDRELSIETAVKKLAGQRTNDEARFSCLWDILVDILSQERCGSVNIVLDALDECKEDEREQLIAGLTRLGHDLQLSGRSVKVIVTSRPYAAIRRSFKSFQAITIQADDNLDAIDEDIKAVVASRVRTFASSIGTKREDLLAKFSDKLQTKADHTFLWISLILDMLDKSEDCSFEEINQLMDNPNPGVDALYGRILEKAKNTDKARRMLHIVVGAVEPLTLDEINIAWAVKIGHRLTEEELKERMFLSPKVGVREVCGLFVRIVQGKVVLVHQTAREFLVRTMDNNISPTVRATEPTCWKWSLDPRKSDEMLAGICATYLMSNTVKPKLTNTGLFRIRQQSPEDHNIARLLAERPFLAHAATNLLRYTRSLSGTSRALHLCIKLFTTPTDYASWFAIEHQLNDTSGMARALVPPLFVALSMTNSADMIQELVGRGEDIDATNHWGETLLQVAVKREDVALVDHLLGYGPDLGKDRDSHGSPLHLAVQHNSIDIARLLLSHNADRLARDRTDSVPLHYASSPEMVELLLEDLSVQQLGSLDWGDFPPWQRILQDVNCSPDIIPTLDVLIQAMPEDMVDQFQKHVQHLEAVLAEMKRVETTEWAESETAYSSSETLHHVLDSIKQKNRQSTLMPPSRSSISTSPGDGVGAGDILADLSALQSEVDALRGELEP